MGETGCQITKLNVNEKEASELYGPSVHWFRRARWEGGGPEFIKLNGLVLYQRKTLDDFFSARIVKSTSDASARRSRNIAAEV